MIYTLTVNPAVDMSVTADEIKYGGASTRTKNATYSANGKGINVSLVLKHFGMDSKICGFFGGFTGEYIINELKSKGFDILPVMTEGTTRVNTFVSLGDDEIKLVNEGAEVTEENEKELLSEIEGLDDCDMLVISGSSPKGLKEEFYHKLLSVCEKKGIKTITDISSPVLKDILKYNPWLIKPNDEELFEIFGLSVETEDEAKISLQKLYNMGARNILITMGGKGAYFYNGVNTYFAPPVKIKLKSSVCAGDSFLAAFLSKWKNDEESITEALSLATAVGANVAESVGMGDFKNVSLYKESVVVRRI